MPLQGKPIFVLNDIPQDHCAELNRFVYNVPGVPNKISTAYLTQCYSPAPGSYRVVVTKSGKLLASDVCSNGGATSALGGTAMCGPSPAAVDCSNANWAHAPSSGSAPENSGPDPITVAVEDGAIARNLGVGLEGEVGVYLESVVGQSVTKTFVVRNTSTHAGAVHVRWFQYLYSKEALYKHGLTKTSTCGQVLQPNATCEISVTYSPLENSFLRTSPMGPWDYSWLLIVPGLGDDNLAPTGEAFEGQVILQVNHKT